MNTLQIENNLNQNLRRDYTLKEMFGNRVDDIHNFRISEVNAVLTFEQLQSIEAVAEVLPDFVNGMGKLEGLCLVDDKFRRTNKTIINLRNALDLGVAYNSVLTNPERDPNRKALERDFQADQEILLENISTHHPFLRLDIIVDVNGNLNVVEIEENKLHGFGYTTLCRDFSESKIGIGLAEIIKEFTKDNPTAMLLSGFERFYEIEACFFAKRVNALGGDLTVVTQREIDVSLESTKNSRSKIFDQILSLPTQFNNGSEFYRSRNLDALISKNYLLGVTDVLSFKKPLLGNKVCMAIISNALGNVELEQLLRVCFQERTLNVLRAFLPKTILPMSKIERDQVKDKILNGEQLFIKVVDSSGSRGIAAPGNIAAQIELLKNKKVICQEAIAPRFTTFPFIDLMTGETGVDQFSTRYGAFVVNGVLTDIGVTASPGIIAHGGKQSIQTGINILQK